MLHELCLRTALGVLTAFEASIRELCDFAAQRKAHIRVNGCAVVFMSVTRGAEAVSARALQDGTHSDSSGKRRWIPSHRNPELY